MEHRRLRYFLAVAEELHFGRAAARLGIEQSPLSRQIQDLEGLLGVRLFERTRRSTRLTEAGKRFVPDARRILVDVEISVRSLRAFAAGGSPLRLGLAEGLAGTAFGRLLKDCQISEPRIPILLVERPFAEMTRLIGDGALDAVLAPEQPGISELESVVAWSERLTLLTPVGDSGRVGSLVWLKSLKDRPWILPNPHHLPGSARQIKQLLAAKGLSGRAEAAAASPATLIRMIAAGMGVGLLPDSLAVTTDEVALKPLHDPDARLTTWLTTRRDDPSPMLGDLQRLVGAAAQDPHFST